MDRERLFEKLDISAPDEFQYYENFDALIEEEEHIEEELIKEIITEVDKGLLAEHVHNFYESFLSNIPDDETELYIIIDTFKRNIQGLISEDMNENEIYNLVTEIYRFRKWYAIDHNAIDEMNGEDLSVRDARYEIMAAAFLGEDRSFDFVRAITSGPDIYEVKLKDISQ